MTEANGLKVEDDAKVKIESDQTSVLGDEDDYEDTGELQFPKDSANTWLVRTPKDLWNGLDTLKYSEDKIRLGDMHVWQMPDGTTKVRLKINNDVPGFDLIAKEYDLNVQPGAPRNTFIFSERDMPGYRPNAYGRRFVNMRDPLRKTEGGKVEKRQRGPRTITKHTSYVAAPNHEVQCTPRENEEWDQLQERKAALERAGKKDTVVLQVNEAHELLKASKQGNLLNPNDMKKPRPQDMKYQRLEEDVLLNELFKCFQQYKFWHLRTLKDRLKQPEAHLRDVLSKIAVLVKTGPAANSWTLKPEIAQVNQDVEEGLDAKQEDIAPDMASGEMDEDDFDDDDDDDAEMEDVPLSI